MPDSPSGLDEASDVWVRWPAGVGAVKTRGNPCCRRQVAQRAPLTSLPTGGSSDRITQTVLETEESERPPEWNRAPVRVGERKDSRTGATFQGDRFDRDLREALRFCVEAPGSGLSGRSLAESL